jgi:hypothetical protein
MAPLMWFSERFRPAACVVLLLWATLLAAAPSRAQIPASERPDVQVVVMPDPVSGQWAVSAVYPKKVPRSEANTHLQRLLGLTGWKGTDIVFENRQLERAENPFKMSPLPVMSSMTFRSPSNVIDLRSATLPVEPFARAFRDLDRVYLTFFVPATWEFRGLRRHSDANLDVQLASGGQGAYTYFVNIKNHNLGVLNLPRHEVLKPRADTRSAGAREERGTAAAERLRWVGMSLVALLAVGAGLLVYFGIQHRWGAGR